MTGISCSSESGAAPITYDDTKGLVVENKTGCQFYSAKMVIDTTGDADELFRAGVPAVQGRNFHTYLTKGANVESCRAAAEKGDMAKMFAGK